MKRITHGLTARPGRLSPRAIALALSVVAGAASGAACAGEWSGSVSVQTRVFPHDPSSDRQFDRVQWSLALDAEYVEQWDNGDQQLVFSPFFRLDQRDDERTHGDIRELLYSRAADAWELRVGIGRVFWGVTEFLHLVDIINQTDLVENQDEEDKLGQPMLNLSLIRDWGTLDFYLLPGFRERTFAGPEGRPHGGLAVDVDNPDYESGAENKHIDAALRWSRSIGDWDIGLAHFYGTSREPRLLLRSDERGRMRLTPRYDIIHQTSIDLQYTTEEWLWKLEALRREGQGDTFFAAIGGFEYSFVGVFDSVADVGIIAEYAYDDRRREAATPFENDLVIGARVAMNDAASTEFLAGAVFDLDNSGRFYTLEASRRIGDDYTLSVEARLSDDLQRNDPAYAVRNEDYVQLELSWYF